MFICEKCLEEKYDNFAIGKSYGKCEDCGITGYCYDIPCSKLIDKVKEVKLYLSRKSAMELIELKQELGFMPKLSEQDLELLIDRMIKVSLGTLN